MRPYLVILLVLVAPAALSAQLAWAQAVEAPSAPDLVLKVRYDAIVASWEAPSGAPVDNYVLHWRTGALGSGQTVEVAGTSHVITGLDPGKTYWVKVEAVNSAGTSGWSTTQSAVAAMPPSPPDAPSNLKLSASYATIDASWTAPTSIYAASYVLHWRTGALGSGQTVEVTGTSHVITGLDPGQDYWVRVASVNSAGTSGWSTTQQVTTAVPTSPPGVPRDLSVLEKTFSSVRMSWTAPSGDIPATKYQVQWKKPDAAEWSAAVDVTTGTSHTITGLDPGQTYQVRVKAANAAGSGSWSAVESVTLNPAPLVISDIQDQTVAAGSLFEYTPEVSNPQNQQITYSLSAKPPGATINSNTGAITWQTSVADITGRPVHFAVTASAGTYSASKSFYVTVLASVPGAPSAPTLTPVHTAIHASWTEPDNDGGSTITGYQIRWKQHLPSSSWGEPVDVTTGTSHLITGLESIRTYAVQVRAVNSAGAGAWSALSQATTPPPGPPAPITLVADHSSIAASWPAPHNDDTLDYQIRWMQADAAGDWGEPADITTGTSYTITGLDHGKAYEVQVRTINSGVAGGWSAVVRATTTNDGPVITGIPDRTIAAGSTFTHGVRASDPDGDALTYSLLAAPGGGSIDRNGLITWQTGANDVGPHTFTVSVSDGALSDTESFTVTVRAVGGGGGTQPSNSPPSVTSISDQTVASGSTFTHGVRASDPDGDALTYSLLAAPGGGSIDRNGLITWQTGANDVGPHTFTVSVSDGALSDTESFTVTVRAGGPSVMPIPDRTIAAGSTLTYDVQASDPDGDALTYSLLDAPDGASINEAGRILWSTTTADPGDYTFVVSVSDARETVTASFAVTVLGEAAPTADNTAPSLTPIPDQRVRAGDAFAYAVQASDPDGDPLEYALDGPANAAISAAGLITWQTGEHDASDVPYSFAVSVSDGRHHIMQSFGVTVAGTKMADAGLPQRVTEGGVVVLDGSGSGTGASFSWSAPSGITLSGADTPTPQFTAPEVDQSTAYTFTLTVTGVDGSVDHSSVTVTVADSRTAPVCR